MALEAINEIKIAEAKAEELILEAKAKAREIVQSATLQSEGEYNKILEVAKASKDKLIDDAIKQGENDAEPILIKGNKEVDDINNMSQEKKDMAIKLVVERIVKIHGNS
ncbi:ATPase [Clostridium gasigenes]|uniref:ATPase n=1 Tax=Clostridium gasigenes TaxID=94869 RepID=UPI001C0DD703|nr:ATPase [Clostridium gasigenes]MBU3108371.1 ATPase [Clostridium gasigenes]